MPKQSPTSAERTTRRTLRDLSRATKRTPEESKKIWQEITQSSDRTACIIMSAMVERILERVLILRLMIEENKVPPLFERGGALSTFFGNIYLAHALNLVSEEIRDDLNTVRSLRNAFAHSQLPIAFQSYEVKRELNKLRYKNYSDIEEGESLSASVERKQFVSCCLALMIALNDALDRYLTFHHSVLSAAQRSDRVRTEAEEAGRKQN